MIGFDGNFEPERTVLVCWTPREIVRRAVAPIAARYGIPYVVHLEDNEEHLGSLERQRCEALAMAAEAYARRRHRSCAAHGLPGRRARASR